MDAAASGGFARRAKRCSVRRSRVVLAPRPWRQFCGRYPADDGDKKRRSPGRARISRKDIARGKPGCLGCTCRPARVLRHAGCPCAPVHGIYGRSQRPAFPAPSTFRGTTRLQNSGKSCRENVFGCLQTESSKFSVVPGASRDPYAAADVVQRQLVDGLLDNDALWLWVACSRRDDIGRCGESEPHTLPASSITSSTSSIVISTGLSPRTSRPSARSPR